MNKSFFRITLRKQATGRSSEKGVYLLIVAGGIVGLLTIVGLVIDVANIFRARLVLQSATDAAAIAGLAYIATYDTSSDTYVDTGKAIAREILCRNLAGRNITVGRSGTPCRSSSDITMTYTNNRIDNPSLSVSANGDVSLYLMHLVSGALSQNLIVAQATSEINRAHVSLMLDTSDSMQCDANLTNTPHCGCTGPGNTCASTDTKLHYLQQAVQNFLDYFDPGRDRINLIPYNTGATMEAPHGAPFANPGANPTFDRTTLKARISTLTAAGMTNPCDALLQSYMESERLSVLDQTAYVIFSDGAPTAGRFWFAYNANFVGAPGCNSSTVLTHTSSCLTSGSRTHGSMPTNNVWKVTRSVAGIPSKPNIGQQKISLYDYYNWGYSTTFTDTTKTPPQTKFTIIPSRLIAAPGGLSQRIWNNDPHGSHCSGTVTTPNWGPYGFQGPGMPSICPDTNDGTCNKACPLCSYMVGYEDRPAFGWLCFGSNNDYYAGAAPFYTPDGQLWHTPINDENDPHESFPVDIVPNPWDPAGTKPYRWWRMYYDCAIAMSDAAKGPGGLLFTIGLGTPASGGALDPYQAVSDTVNRKDVFLRRLAHDVCGKLDPPFEGVDTYDQMQGRGYRHGMAVLTTDAAELDDLFRAVALKIKTKLLR